MKKATLFKISLFILCAIIAIFVGYLYVKKAIHNDSNTAFESLESTLNNPLYYISNITLKIDKIPTIDENLQSITMGEIQSYQQVNAIAKKEAQDKWGAPLMPLSIKVIATYFYHLNQDLLVSQNFCVEFNKTYKNDENLALLRLLDFLILDENDSQKTIEKNPANLNLIAKDSELKYILANLLQSNKEILLDKYKILCHSFKG